MCHHFGNQCVCSSKSCIENHTTSSLLRMYAREIRQVLRTPVHGSSQQHDSTAKHENSPSIYRLMNGQTACATFTRWVSLHLQKRMKTRRQVRAVRCTSSRCRGNSRKRQTDRQMSGFQAWGGTGGKEWGVTATEQRPFSPDKSA
jgi:hypothetical protein